MLITKPSYFDTFRCIAGACPDSCCKEWDVQVDAAAAAHYRALPGDLGNRLREVLYDEDGETYMAIVDRRCPMWRDDGLCRIQAELGEGALCKTCREFPRLTHDYGDFIEYGLELSCPEAARILFATPDATRITREVPGGEEPEYDTEAMALLKASREQMLALLSDNSRDAADRLILALLYGYQAQSELDGGDVLPFDPDSALEEARNLAKPGSKEEILNFFRSLEILTSQWKQRLDQPAGGDFPPQLPILAKYMVERYWLQAVSDYDLYSRVKFTVIACLLMQILGGDLVSTAQLFSKEIENSADNVDTILDAAYSHPAFTDDKLLGLLLDV